MKARVQLRPDAPALYRAAFASIPEFTVTTGPDELIELDGTERQLTLLARPPRTPDGLRLSDLRPKPGTVGLIVARSLTARDRASLEEAGLSWCDARGSIHLTWPGLYFHVDRGTRPTTRLGRVPSSGVGVTSLRGIQTMLANPEAPWSVARLAQAAVLSTGQAHNVLKTLESNRLLRTEGSGPKQRRYLRDRDETMEWLAGVERARRRPETAPSYLYARTFDDLIDRFAERASEMKLTYAITAASAATALGYPVLTNPVVIQVRVGHIEAAHALDLLGLEHLDAEGAGRGTNLELWTDTGELGTFHTETVDNRSREVRVAPRVRIWLDMVRQGGRHADAANLFKEQAID